jgi:ATP-binding cassette, subfamily B, bacterial
MIFALAGHSLHRRMGIVQQQNFPVQRDGCRQHPFCQVLKRPMTTFTDVLRKLDCEDLFLACRRACRHQVGEGGATVSSGQRQLICFARAMLLIRQFLCLMKPPAASTARPNHDCRRALEILLTGRTAFVVAHRLSTIRNADQVLVLDHGRIVERGTHDALIQEQGVYASLYEKFSKH